MNMINQALCGPPRPPPETRLKKTEDRLEAHFANVTFESAIDTRCVEDEAAKRLFSGTPPPCPIFEHLPALP